MGINRQIRSARWGCILQFEIGWPMKALKKATFKKLPSGEASCEDIWRRWYRQRETKVQKTYFKLRIIRLTHSWLQQLWQCVLFIVLRVKFDLYQVIIKSIWVVNNALFVQDFGILFCSQSFGLGWPVSNMADFLLEGLIEGTKIRLTDDQGLHLLLMCPHSCLH